jgi:hypothetical protein
MHVQLKLDNDLHQHQQRMTIGESITTSARYNHHDRNAADTADHAGVCA